MISRILSWILELFRAKPRELKDLEEVIENHKQKIEEIEDAENSPADDVDYLNK